MNIKTAVLVKTLRSKGARSITFARLHFLTIGIVTIQVDTKILIFLTVR